MPNTYFHIAIQDPQDQDHITEILETAGIIVSDITETTHEHDGIIMTRRMAAFTWDSQTSNDDCDKSCISAGEPPHRPFDDLSEEQQNHFATRVLDFMNRHRGDLDMNLTDMIRMQPPVATEPCN